MPLPDTPCNVCEADDKWPSMYPKPSCRMKRDMENVENVVTKGVYREILKNREEDKIDIPCPMVRLNERK